jgi:hypothetical protein
MAPQRNTTAAVEARLAAIRAAAPRRSPTVRVLAAYAGHADCNLASLGFAARVDFDRLLMGTEYQAHFGQSPFAFVRGRAFERMIAQHGYAATLELLRTNMGFGVSDARIVNLRDVYQKNSAGMGLRANHTRVLIRQLLAGDPKAPNLIDGAVLEASIGGIAARFEADALAARFGGPIHAGEVKSFPVVDGRAESDKLAAALDQVSVYILLTKRLVGELGGDADLVSPTAMLITPKNVGLQPTLSVQDVSRRIARVERLLAAVPDVYSIADSMPAGLSFGIVGDPKADSTRRIEALHDLADRVGTEYAPSCLSTCGNGLFCRERAFRAGAPCLTGPEAERLLPGVHSLQRAAELSEGAPPAKDEAAVARHLARAGRLYDATTRRLRMVSGPGGLAV